MNKLLLVLLLLIISNISKAQYVIGHTTITYTDSSRNNRTIATEIYYPADVTGDNVPLLQALSCSLYLFSDMALL